MQVTTEHVIWIVAGVIIASIITIAFLNWGQSAAQRADLAVFDVQAYSDGTVYFTVKNTGTVPITQITIDSASASGTLPLEGGQESQFKATGLSLTAGEMHQFEIVATFSNGQTKELRVKAIVRS
mgnify:CR=1 FL=1